MTLSKNSGCFKIDRVELHFTTFLLSEVCSFLSRVPQKSQSQLLWYISGLRSAFRLWRFIQQERNTVFFLPDIFLAISHYSTWLWVCMYQPRQQGGLGSNDVEVLRCREVSAHHYSYFCLLTGHSCGWRRYVFGVSVSPSILFLKINSFCEYFSNWAHRLTSTQGWTSWTKVHPCPIHVNIIYQYL